MFGFKDQEKRLGNPELRIAHDGKSSVSWEVSVVCITSLISSRFPKQADGAS